VPAGAAAFCLSLVAQKQYDSRQRRVNVEVSRDVEDIGFELLASSLRADAADLNAFVEALATKLEGALPTQTVVERKPTGLFSKTKRVHRISIDMGNTRYDLVADGGRVQAGRGTAVRGIVLKTEQLPLDRWIDELSRELTEEAQRSEQARIALERLLGA
jgi:hypothetical protein